MRITSEMVQSAIEAGEGIVEMSYREARDILEASLGSVGLDRDKMAFNVAKAILSCTEGGWEPSIAQSYAIIDAALSEDAPARSTNRDEVKHAAKTLLLANGADLEEWSDGNLPADIAKFLKPLAGEA